MAEKVLELNQLAVSFFTPQGEIQAVRGVDLSVEAGEIVCIVGESGCGKTALCKAVMGLLPEYAKIKKGRIRLSGRDITNSSEKELRKLRGAVMSMVFQDPLTMLNPGIPTGRQIMEMLQKHQRMSRRQAKQRALELMERMGIEEAKERFSLQPHFFSGGMRQRCILAAALASEPQLLLADEVTTALDVTVETKILDLLLEIRERTGTAIVFVTHDLGAAARIADRVAVMYAGRILEIGKAEEVFYTPQHPYTWGLLSSMPVLASGRDEPGMIPGQPPSLLNPPPGAAFACRNPYVLAIDYEEMPPMFAVSETHYAATWLLDAGAPQVEGPKFGDFCTGSM